MDDDAVGQYLHDLDQVLARGSLSARLEDWSMLRASLATELPLLGRALTGARTILDAGCGQGWHACFLARQGRAVVGVDVRREQLCVARALALELGVSVHFVEGRIETLPRALGKQRRDVVMESAVLPIAQRRDVEPKLLRRQAAVGRSFLRGIRQVAARSGATFVSLEGGRRIESLKAHVDFVTSADFRLESIQGPCWFANTLGLFAVWLIKAVPGSRRQG